MDVLASEIDTEPPWAMLFAHDLVLCKTTKAAVERKAWAETQPDKNSAHAVQGL